MKNIFLFLLLILSGTLTGFSQTEIKVDPSRSMSLIGKGPGQDSVINPYAGSDSEALITNMGDFTFEIRIQKNGEILRIIPVAPGKTEKIELISGEELYLDGSDKEKSTAWVDFRKI